MTEEYQKLLLTVIYDTTQVELGEQFESSKSSTRTSPVQRTPEFAGRCTVHAKALIG